MKFFNKILIPLGVTCILLLVYYQTQNNFLSAQKPNDIQAKTFPSEEYTSPQRIHPVRIKNSFEFAGEKIPLEEIEVRERLDRELMVNTFWHSNTMLNYKLSTKYFDFIEPILEKYNIPDDFKYLAVAESGLRHVVSPAGAAGFWQFLKATAKEYGLEVNDYVDERYHLEKATEAACKYILEAKEKFGTWTLAAASYNIGMGRLESIIEEQKVNSYYDLYLNTETSRYIFRIAAYKALFDNPKEFGYNFIEEDLYQNYEYETLEIDTNINNLAQFAIDNNTTYKLLKYMNPWLRNTKLNTSSDKTYSIKIAIKNFE